ncbi:MAG TPA: sortase [Aliicoccus persicus]|uniref:Sortase n=1 Tax=Aliicoccus persicus TaxID=930138 RepID=A0A921JBD4_9STAP|nr:sortase [Aliicoccus persicus]
MRVLMRLLGLLLIGAAVVLFFWQDIQEYFTDRVNDRIIEAFHNGEENVEIAWWERFITGIDSYDGNTARADSNKSQGVRLSGNMEGVLNIPSANISEPVFGGEWTEEKLRNGLSFVNEDDHIDMQNVLIAGHRVEGAGIRFNHLDRAEIGDKIEFITRDGTREFVITEIELVDPSAVEVMNQDPDPNASQEMTLITCDDYNPETMTWDTRLIVKAEIVE